jgi:hypothetical protein
MKSPAPLIDRLLPRLGTVFILAGLAVAAEAQQTAEKPAAPAKQEGEAMVGRGKGALKPAADPAVQMSNGMKAFFDMIPPGVRNRGAKIPAFEDGLPTSLITADFMTRVDDNRIFGEVMRIHLFGTSRPEDLRVDLKTGTYNLDNQVLSSTERSKVQRSDFKIEGDGLVFDTKTSQGKMVGNVEMTIFDAKAFAKSTTSPGGAQGGEGPAEKKSAPGEEVRPPLEEVRPAAPPARPANTPNPKK